MISAALSSSEARSSTGVRLQESKAREGSGHGLFGVFGAGLLVHADNLGGPGGIEGADLVRGADAVGPPMTRSYSRPSWAATGRARRAWRGRSPAL